MGKLQSHKYQFVKHGKKGVWPGGDKQTQRAFRKEKLCRSVFCI